MNKYIVNFYDDRGVCYFRDEAIHADISTHTILIDFSKNGLKYKDVFRAVDEMQQIDVICNLIKIRFLSGQTITITRC